MGYFMNEDLSSEDIENLDCANEIMEIIKKDMPKFSDEKSLLRLDFYLKENPLNAKRLLHIICDFADNIDSNKGRFMAEAKHKKIREKKNTLRAIWASGKYKSRDVCAEQECASLGISFSTARKTLINLIRYTEPKI